MKGMNGKNKIVVLIILVIMAAAIAAAIGSLAVTGAAPEHQIRTRWGLSKSQINEIRQLIERYRHGEISQSELEFTIMRRFRDWGFIPPPNVPIPDLELFYTARSIITTVNVTLVLILLMVYMDAYKKTGAQFALGLIIFSLILLLYTLSSNPFIQMLFGFRAFGLGPFAMLPDMLALIALIILLYLSLK
ncbi:MAG: hypothetical protein QXX99_04935 [Candidatus Bathyarchaeia archaeon]